jgi:sulfofructosephosphate aldolase
MRRFIVNADDLGFTDGVNRGIVEAHESGIVTSASLMVDQPGTAHAVELANGAPRLSVGLHVVLDERGELLVPPEHCARELERQLGRFRELMRCEPTHVDSHHHVHRDPRMRAAFVAFADRHGLPLRDHSSARYCGVFYGQGSGGVSRPENVSVDRLLAIVDGLDGGTTELGCHPGYADGLQSRYTAEREQELRTLTDSRVRRRIDERGVQLVNFDALDRPPTLDALARDTGTFLMVAMDQRESLRTLLGGHHPTPIPDERLVAFKQAVARELGPLASGFLIDRHYGFDIVAERLLSSRCGLILAADALEQPRGGIVEDTHLDHGVDAAAAAARGAVALKLLVIWRDDAERDRRVEMSRRFVELARTHRLLSVLEGVARHEDRDAAIVEAARELASVGPSLYKCEVPTHGRGSSEEIERRCREIDAVLECPWVVLSQGVAQEDFPRAVEAACRGGASGILAGRAIWSDTLADNDPSMLLRDRAVPRLRHLAAIVDAHGRPWRERPA